MKLRVAHLIGPLIALGLFSLALRVLYRELGSLHYDDVVAGFSSIPRRDLWLALFFTVMSYFVLTLYDVLAIRYVNFKLSYPKVAMASFVGYTLSHNLGFPLITGGAARYRLYSSWGLSAVQIAQAIAYSGLVFWVGFLLLSSIVLVLDPPLLPSGYSLIFSSLRPFGFACLVLVIAYFVLFRVRNRAFKIKGLEFPVPPFRLSVGGVIVSAIDWMLAANVTYMLLPQTSLNYVEFLGLFLIGQVAGLLSHVPGGLGVFEATVLMFMSDKATPSQLAGSLLAYRFIYYFLPLACSCALMAVHESMSHGRGLMKIFSGVFADISKEALNIISLALFCAGAMLFFSSALPSDPHHLTFLKKHLSLWVVEGAHYLTALSGVGLILISRGITHKLRSSYTVSLLLLYGGAVFALLKDLNYVQAAILIVLALALRPLRGRFYRRTSLLAQAFEPGWTTAVILIFAAGIGLMFFAYRHMDYSNSLWLQLGWKLHAARSLRAMGLACVATVIWTLVRLLMPSRGELVPSGASDLNVVEPIVRSCPRSYGFLALLGDKSLLLNPAKRGFVMFTIEGISVIAMGDPVASGADTPDLIWQFREYCERHASDCVFYQISEENVPHYRQAGLECIKIGREAQVALGAFDLEHPSHSGIRSTKKRLAREGYQVRIVDGKERDDLLPSLSAISDAWLRERNLQEHAFSFGFYSPGYLSHLPLAIVLHGETPVGFGPLWPGGDKQEISMDFFRYTGNPSAGLLEFAFVEALLWAQAEGYREFNLGMAPLPEGERAALVPLWSKLGNVLFRHGEHFYNFESILNFKAKWNPVWRPMYLAAPNGLALTRIIANLAELHLRGPRGIFAKPVLSER